MRKIRVSGGHFRNPHECPEGIFALTHACSAEHHSNAAAGPRGSIGQPTRVGWARVDPRNKCAGMGVLLTQSATHLPRTQPPTCMRLLHAQIPRIRLSYPAGIFGRATRHGSTHPHTRITTRPPLQTTDDGQKKTQRRAGRTGRRVGRKASSTSPRKPRPTPARGSLRRSASARASPPSSARSSQAAQRNGRAGRRSPSRTPAAPAPAAPAPPSPKAVGRRRVQINSSGAGATVSATSFGVLPSNSQLTSSGSRSN